MRLRIQLRLRTQCSLAILAAAFLSVALTATAQDHRDNRWADRSQSSFDLLRRDRVKQELKLTDEQKEKLSKVVVDERAKMRPLFSGSRGKTQDERREFWTKVRGEMRKVRDASMAKINKVLQPEQQARLEQITLQVQIRRSGAASPSAIRAVAKALGLTDEERQKLVAGAEAIRKRLAEKMEAANKQAADELIGMLTDEQRRELKKLTGEEFHLPTRRSNDRDRRGGRTKKDGGRPTPSKKTGQAS